MDSPGSDDSRISTENAAQKSRIKFNMTKV